MQEFKYPMWFKHKSSGAVIKFNGVKSGVVIVGSRIHSIGASSDNWIDHNNTNEWENVTHLYQETVSDEKTSIPPLELCGTPYSIEEKGHNNGGSTDYYKLKIDWKDCVDIMEDRAMNYNQGNIFKSAFCFNVGRHDGTDYERELNKIVYFAERELKRIKNVEA